VDLHTVHFYGDDVEEANDFFNALADSQNFDIFLSKPISKLIEYKYPVVKEATVKYLFYPYLAYLLTFVVYMNVFQSMKYFVEDQTDAKYDTYKEVIFYINIFFQLLLTLFSIYFLRNEVKQMLSEDSIFAYFLQMWNYVDIIPPLLMFVMIFLD